MSDEVNIVKTRKSDNKSENQLIYKVILGIIIIVAVAGLSFYWGVSYQKGHTSSSPTASHQGPGGFGGFGGGRFSGSRTVGTVSTISSTSITVQPQNGSAKTYTINGSTVISDNGSTVSYSSIKNGDTVFVISGSSTSTVATRILVNPSFGGFGGGGNTPTPNGSSTNGSGTNSSGSSTSPSTTLN